MTEHGELLGFLHDLLTGPAATALAAGVSARLGLAPRVDRLERAHASEQAHRDHITPPNTGATTT